MSIKPKFCRGQPGTSQSRDGKYIPSISSHVRKESLIPPSCISSKIIIPRKKKKFSCWVYLHFPPSLLFFPLHLNSSIICFLIQSSFSSLIPSPLFISKLRATSRMTISSPSSVGGSSYPGNLWKWLLWCLQWLHKQLLDTYISPGADFASTREISGSLSVKLSHLVGSVAGKDQRRKHLFCTLEKLHFLLSSWMPFSTSLVGLTTN